MTHDETLAALEDRCPGVKAFTAGPLWSVTLPCGTHTGAREDPFSLLDDLLAIRDTPPYVEPEPEPVAEAPVDGLQDVLARMETARENLAATKADDVPDEPPASIADLFTPDRPYAEQAKALWDKYNELTSKVMLGVATDEERAKQSRLQGELDWIKRHAFEAA